MLFVFLTVLLSGSKYLSCGLVDFIYIVFFKRSFSVLSPKPLVWPSDCFGIHMFKRYLSWFIQVFFLFVTKMCYLTSVSK